MSENTQETQQADLELDSFISRMTEGLEVAPPENTVSQEPVDSDKQTETTEPTKAAEGAPITVQPTPETKAEGDKTSSEPTASNPKKDEKPVDIEEHFDKSSKAFAQLRIENKQKDADFMRLAKLAGFDAKTPEEARTQLDIQLTKFEAKKQNVDPLLLQELQRREAQIAEQEKLQLKKEAHTGFNSLKTQFALDDDKVLAFAQQLQADGINPFEQKVNLEHEYKLRNFDALIAAAKQAGIQEEVARRMKAQKQSTTPPNTVGGAKGTGEVIKNVDELRAFLTSKQT